MTGDDFEVEYWPDTEPAPLLERLKYGLWALLTPSKSRRDRDLYPTIETRIAASPRRGDEFGGSLHVDLYKITYVTPLDRPERMTVNLRVQKLLTKRFVDEDDFLERLREGSPYSVEMRLTAAGDAEQWIDFSEYPKDGENDAE